MAGGRAGGGEARGGKVGRWWQGEAGGAETECPRPRGQILPDCPRAVKGLWIDKDREGESLW